MNRKKKALSALEGDTNQGPLRGTSLISYSVITWDTNHGFDFCQSMLPPPLFDKVKFLKTRSQNPIRIHRTRELLHVLSAFSRVHPKALIRGATCTENSWLTEQGPYRVRWSPCLG